MISVVMAWKDEAGFVTSQATVGDGRQPTQRLQKLKDAGQGHLELLLVPDE